MAGYFLVRLDQIARKGRGRNYHSQLTKTVSDNTNLPSFLNPLNDRALVARINWNSTFAVTTLDPVDMSCPRDRQLTRDGGRIIYVSGFGWFSLTLITCQ